MSERTADRARHRTAHYEEQLASAHTPALRFAAACDWFRAASPGDRVTDAAARELARLARRADARTAGQPHDASGNRQTPGASKTGPTRGALTHAYAHGGQTPSLR